MTMSELTLDVYSFTVIEWDNSTINDSHDHRPPIILFIAEDVGQALRADDECVYYPSLETLTVTRDGIATITRPDGTRLIYELFPARFNDDKPYQPACYVGRWPD